MIEFSLELSKDDRKNLGEVADRLDDLTVPLKRSALIMISSIDKNFAVQGRPNPWVALSPMTISMRGGGDVRILQDTGTLRRSVSYKILGDNSVQVGTNIVYAKKMHFGGMNVIPAHRERVRSYRRRLKGKRVRVKSFTRKVPKRMYVVPARPFIMFQEQDKVAIQGVFSDYVTEVMRG